MRLYFSSSLLQYSSFLQSGHFNSASSSVSPGEVSWLATGIKSTTSNSDVTGTAIYLVSASMSFHSSVAAGTYGSTTLGLYPRATELISGGAFVQDVNGPVLDGRDGVQTSGVVTGDTLTLSIPSPYVIVKMPASLLPTYGPSIVRCRSVHRIQ